jgi:predicted PurR-regulated permease PerM
MYGRCGGARRSVPMSTLNPETLQVHSKSNISQRIIAGGILLAFLYWASTVLITLLISVLMAYFLDPVVEWLERFRIPRATGALVVLLVGTLLLSLVGYIVWQRIEDFTMNWAKYREPLQAVSAAFQERIEKIESRIMEVQPQDKKAIPLVQLKEEGVVRQFLTRGLGGAYVILLAASFVPFLVFFMLAERRDIWHATMQLFPQTERTRVKLALEDLGTMLRSYIIGNLMVAFILGVVSAVFFWAIGLGNPFLVGMVSGASNLIPYIGTVLAWIPPMIVGLATYKTVGPFIGIAFVLTFMHLIAVNVLIPALVGRQVHLNALAVTMALLFWGWMWGGMGLLLGIPLTASVKVACDHVESWKPFGRWLGT